MRHENHTTETAANNKAFLVCLKGGKLFPSRSKFIQLSFEFTRFYVIANEPAERRRSAGEAAENSAARRMVYAKKFSIGIEKCKCKV